LYNPYSCNFFFIQILKTSRFTTTKTGIGKYLPDNLNKRKERDNDDQPNHYNDYEKLIKKQKSKGKTKDNFGDFSSW